MRLLIDNAISPQVAASLTGAGHDTVHVRERGLGAADDGTILELAQREDRVIVSADTDFGTLLALRAQQKPSFVLWRLRDRRTLAEQSRMIAAVLEAQRSELLAGAVVVIDDHRVRIRRLPIGS